VSAEGSRTILKLSLSFIEGEVFSLCTREALRDRPTMIKRPKYGIFNIPWAENT